MSRSRASILSFSNRRAFATSRGVLSGRMMSRIQTRNGETSATDAAFPRHHLAIAKLTLRQYDKGNGQAQKSSREPPSGTL